MSLTPNPPPSHMYAFLFPTNLCWFYEFVMVIAVVRLRSLDESAFSKIPRHTRCLFPEHSVTDTYLFLASSNMFCRTHYFFILIIVISSALRSTQPWHICVTFHPNTQIHTSGEFVHFVPSHVCVVVPYSFILFCLWPEVLWWHPIVLLRILRPNTFLNQKSALRSRILCASTKVMHRPTSNSPLRFDIRTYTKFVRKSARRLLPATLLERNPCLKVGLGFVGTNVRIRWNPVYKAFHWIRICGNEPIIRY